MTSSATSVWSTMASVAGLAVIVVVLLLGAAARGTMTNASRARLTTNRVPRASRQSIRRASIGAAAVLIAAVGYAVGGAIALVLVGATVVVLRRRRRRNRDAARRRAVEAALPDAIELLVLCVHAGRSPTQAVVELASRAPPAIVAGFAAVELQLHRGRGLADALFALPDTIGAEGRELATVIATADREGLPLIPVLDRLAADARAARRRQGEAAARRLPVRLSFPLVGCTLPAFVLLAIAPAVLGALSTLRGEAP